MVDQQLPGEALQCCMGCSNKWFFTESRGSLTLGLAWPGLDYGCELIHLVWRRCRPLPPLRRPTFFLEKVGKTARSCIRPYAALRVPSLRHLPGPRGLRLASPSLRLALFGYAEGATHWPLQAPPLSLLKSHSAAPALACMKIKIKVKSESKSRSGPLPALRGLVPRWHQLDSAGIRFRRYTSAGAARNLATSGG